VGQFLERQGFSIVAFNLRLGKLELDIVARQKNLVVVVEVRTRGPRAWTSPFGSINVLKRTRIRRAGQRLWRERYQKDPSIERMRFDAASVVFDGAEAHIEYVPAAF
jgi:putative endonuclease